MDDLISRQDAIDAIKKELYLTSFFRPRENWSQDGRKTVSNRRVVKSLPSAPERRGKWERLYLADMDGWRPFLYACSECNAKYSSMYNYCPHCGTRMESEE